MNQSMFVLSLLTVKENQLAQCGKDGFRETWVYGRGGMTRHGDIACAEDLSITVDQEPEGGAQN